jgi:predicted AAA+ superfamily ATPase
MAEGLVRNIPAFFRFLDSVGYCHNEIIIFSNIARDAGVDSKTVREYFQILADTLLGVFIEPFDLRPSRDIISRASKFYLFDVGLAGSIQKRTILEEKGSQFGQAFEHFILMELLAHRSYRELFYEINFWRTKAGYEADFILDKGRIALEIKGTSSAGKMELRSLNQFIGDYNPQKAILVCNEKYPRQAGNILILPWRIFLQKLWQGEII